MKYLQKNEFSLGDVETGEDAVPSAQAIEIQFDRMQRELNELPADAPLEQRLKLMLDACYLLLDLERKEEAWENGREALDLALPQELWTQAVEAYDIMYQADRPESIRALAHGIWLGVTFPIDPELSVAMLQHLVDETPDNSDGAAVAAATAAYVVDMRAEGQQREDLQFFTGQLLAQVARRHSQVEEQEIFDFWVEQLELKDPSKFLPRLATVLDVIADYDWWYDRDELRARIPED
jgi:hypothetical protein